MNVDILWHILIIAVPLILSNTLHMVVVKYSLLEDLNIPISIRLFGRNKTYRGFLFLTTVNALIFLAFIRFIAVPIEMPYWYGALLGFFYLFRIAKFSSQKVSENSTRRHPSTVQILFLVAR